MATPTYDLIATTTLASSASSVSFFGIPNTWKDLVLVIEATRDTDNFNVACILNSDTGSNYSWVAMAGTGSFAVSTTDTSRSNIPLGFYAQARDTAHLSISHFMDYSATDKHKTVLTRANNVDNGTAAHAARWANTAAITTITVISETAGRDFASGSTFSLFGIAG